MGRFFCIGDIHGCSNTLDNLLCKKIKLLKSDSLIFIGDYIDRGPDSKGVIDIILNLQKKYDVTCLLGNHEDLYMESETDDELFIHWFKYCGGFQTLKSFNVTSYGELKEEYKYFFKTLLHVKIIGKKYILVHAGLNFKNKDIFSDKYSLLWERDTQIDYLKLKNRVIIHGHTPQSVNSTKKQLSKIITNKIINIDNGCVFSNEKKLGFLSAIELNSLTIFTERNREINL